MSIIDDPQLFQVMQGMNPWWKGETFRKYSFHRASFHETLHWVTKPDWNRATVISGPRRVGKTVILMQLIEYFISNGWEPKEIFYLSLDHPLVKLTAQERMLDHILDVYRENTLGGKGRTLLLLDEVQYYKDWPTWIKHAVDFQPDLKIVATGSAAVELATGSQESGVGRWTTIKVPTLSFYEHLCLSEFSTPELHPGLRVMGLPKLQKDELADLVLKTADIKDHFHDYLMKGGFPELVLEKDLAEVQRILREDVVEKVLKRDMTAAFGIRNVTEMERLFIYFCLHSGGIVDKKMLSKEIGVSASTVSNYIEYLSSAGLLYHLAPMRQSGKMGLKGRRKAYISDTSVRNAVLMKGQEILANSDEMGLIIETAVYKHFYSYHYQQIPRFGYWRNKKDQEVDLVQIFPNGLIIPIEVKYKSQTTNKDEKNLRELIKISQAKTGIMVVKQAEEFDILSAGKATIIKIPAYLLLYLLGHSEYMQVQQSADM